MTSECPRCGEPTAGSFATEPGVEGYVPCGCRVATDGGSVQDETDETAAWSTDGIARSNRLRRCDFSDSIARLEVSHTALTEKHLVDIPVVIGQLGEIRVPVHAFVTLHGTPGGLPGITPRFNHPSWTLPTETERGERDV